MCKKLWAKELRLFRKAGFAMIIQIQDAVLSMVAMSSLTVFVPGICNFRLTCACYRDTRRHRLSCSKEDRYTCGSTPRHRVPTIIQRLGIITTPSYLMMICLWTPTNPWNKRLRHRNTSSSSYNTPTFSARLRVSICSMFMESRSFFASSVASNLSI